MDSASADAPGTAEGSAAGGSAASCEAKAASAARPRSVNFRKRIKAYSRYGHVRSFSPGAKYFVNVIQSLTPPDRHVKVRKSFVVLRHAADSDFRHMPKHVFRIGLVMSHSLD